MLFSILKSNWIIVAVTLLYVAASIQYFARGDWRTALVFLGYWIANIGTIALIVKGN